MSNHPVITIDGPAGSGKSTAARLLARRLGYTHVDTGALYRTLTLLAIERGVDLADEAALAALVAEIDVRFEPADDGVRVFSGDREVSEDIRTAELTAQVKYAARSPQVRSALRPVQRAFAERSPVVMEGRDIGTVIFPDAEVKFYLDAAIEVRAERRWRELAARGESISREEVQRQEAARDESDLGREVAPLRRAEDAVLVDTGGRSVEETADRLAGLARERLGKARTASASRVGLWYRFCRLICRVALRSFTRLRTWGMENVPADGGLIMACNHQSYLDPPLVCCMLARESRYLARSTLFAFSPLGWLLRSVGAMPLGRGESDRSALRRAEAVLRAGWLLTLFPEGTRTSDGGLQRLKPGVASLAMRAGVAVMPVYIHGAFEVWPRTGRLPRPAPVSILYGKPIAPPADGEGSRRQRAEKLTERLQAALEELERKAFELRPLGTRSAPARRVGEAPVGPSPVDPPRAAAEKEARTTGRSGPDDGNSLDGESGTGSPEITPGALRNGQS